MLDYPILSDPTRETAIKYGVAADASARAKRWTFYISADRKVLAIDTMVKSGNHGADIAARLKELGIPEKK